MVGNEETLPAKDSFTLEDLQDLLINFAQRYQATMVSAPAEEFGNVRQQLHEEFIESQLKNKEGYRQIFKTESGSVYFVTQTGESLRVRKDPHIGWQLQFPQRKIIFIDEEERVRLRKLTSEREFPRNFDNLIIKKTDLKVGAVPIEFGIVETFRDKDKIPQLIPFTETTESLTIGEQTINANLRSNGFHRGHPITEILK